MMHEKLTFVTSFVTLNGIFEQGLSSKRQCTGFLKSKRNIIDFSVGCPINGSMTVKVGATNFLNPPFTAMTVNVRLKSNQTYLFDQCISTKEVQLCAIKILQLVHTLKKRGKKYHYLLVSILQQSVKVFVSNITSVYTRVWS